MRLSTLWLALTAAAIGCSGSDDSAGTNEWRPTDGGTAGSTDGSAGSAGADAASDGGACTPKTCTQLSAVCGTAPDQCGGVVSCGSCPDGQTCGGSGANKCGTATCSSKTCAQLGASCGWVSDQCGSALDCGTCPTGQTCGGAGVPNQRRFRIGGRA